MSGGWRSLLAAPDTELVLLWTGGREARDSTRIWRIGRRPPEHGFWRFKVDGGLYARFSGGGRDPEPTPEWVLDGAEGWPKVTGYVVGDQLIPDTSPRPRPGESYLSLARRIYAAPPGLRHFARVAATAIPGGATDLVYLRDEFPLGPEPEVERAYQDRAVSVGSVSHVPPALDLAFHLLTEQRLIVEAAREAIERERELERQREEARQALGSADGRRLLARHGDFHAAARAALAVSGAELLDVQQGYSRNERVVTFRFRDRRFECVADAETLRIVDSGICLRGNDRLFTLESLPSTISEAMDRRVLHVFRHVGDGYDGLDDDLDD